MSFRSLSIVALATLAFVFVGAAPRPADAQTPAFTLKLATAAPDGTPWAKGLQDFKKQAEAQSGGKIQVRPFLGGVLGDENETVQSCQTGQIQGVGASTGAIASVVPELSVLELPFLFRNEAEADYILDTVITPTVEAALTSRGFVLGFWSENGYRSFGTTYGFVKSPADLKGHKLRSQENPAHIEMYKAFGASPVPIPVTEVLTSLQTGVVDGYDNTPLFAFAAQWTSATKFYSVTRHIYQPAAIVYNKKWFDTLPPDVKTAITTGVRGNLVPQMRREIRALTPILLDNLKAMRVQVYELTPAERATFEGPAKVARDAYLAKAGTAEKALHAKIVAGLDTWRKTH
jgi:tripartite ATP-independent transporter DctP family solute receptor